MEPIERYRGSLLGLAAGHLVLGIIAALLALIKVPSFYRLDDILMVPLIGLILCQALLLALWVA